MVHWCGLAASRAPGHRANGIADMARRLPVPSSITFSHVVVRVFSLCCCMVVGGTHATNKPMRWEDMVDPSL